jgi:hypothetical protein
MSQRSWRSRWLLTAGLGAAGIVLASLVGAIVMVYAYLLPGLIP